mgnify:CR=1 FL=1
MSSLLAENMLWRNIYCNVSKSSSDCIDMGYSFGIIPSGFEWLAFILSAISLIGLVINGVLGGVIVLIWGERRLFYLILVSIIFPIIVFIFFETILGLRFPPGIITNIYYQV